MTVFHLIRAEGVYTKTLYQSLAQHFSLSPKASMLILATLFQDNSEFKMLLKIVNNTFSS